MATAPAHMIVGRVRRAHGLRGELIVEALTDAPAAIFAAGRRVFAGTAEGDRAPDDAELHILRAAPVPNGTWRVAFAGIDDRTAAEAWRHRYLLLPVDEIAPPDESQAFLHELEGMEVETADGRAIGPVLDWYELPQGILVDVAWQGNRVTLPLHGDFIVALDREARRIVLDLPEGLLD